MRLGRPHRIEPGPGQESVWDYPRPPAVVATTRRVRVALAGVTIADSTCAVRVLETSQPPAFYIPPSDIAFEYLTETRQRTFCEWKGQAHYYSLRVGEATVPDVAWAYRSPAPGYTAIADHLAFYPQRLDCSVEGEAVQANEGGFYGGWITSDVVGPFKGGAGSTFW